MQIVLTPPLEAVWYNIDLLNSIVSYVLTPPLEAVWYNDVIDTLTGKPVLTPPLEAVWYNYIGIYQLRISCFDTTSRSSLI